ncbi:MAG: stage II sporulation protein M [Candidatus Korarchaeum sp.]
MIPTSGAEDPLIGLRTSRVSERAVAHLIDLLIVLAIQLPLTLLITFTSSFKGLLGPILILSTIPLVLLLYFTLLEGLTSTTVGKRLLDLRVISLNSMSGPSLAESFIRNLFRFSDMLTLYLPILILRGGRRIGDALAGTIVVSRDFLRVELPEGDSQLSKELRESIVRAVLLELESLPERFEGGRVESPMRDRVSEVLRGEDESVLNRVAYFLSYPSLQLSLLGAEGIARIYERAAELCGGECGRILVNRAAIMRALFRRPRRMGDLNSIFKRAPEEFRRSARYFIISLSLFAIPALSAYYLRPEWMEELIRELLGKDLPPTEVSPLMLSCIIFLNNLRVVLATLGMAPLAFMPFLTLAVNGILVGLVASLHDPLEVALLILPHGVPELTSIFISTSISLRVLGQLLRGDARWSRAREVAMGSVNLAAFSILLLLYSATVEGFLTRWLSSYPLLDIAFSIGEAFAIYSYLLVTNLRTSRGS